MEPKIKVFDIAEQLETDEDIRAFLEEAATTSDSSEFIHVLNIAAKAKGMTEVARQAGVTRASLYKTLSKDGNPGFETISKIVSALGCHLAVVSRI